MGKILRQYLNDLQDEYRNLGFVYNPNSIYHGSSRRVGACSYEEIQLRMSNARLQDFIEYLFEHSEHCDHISQGEAWDEFAEYEFKNSNMASEYLPQDIVINPPTTNQ